MIPIGTFYVMVAINVILGAGWGFTLTRAMRRSMQAFEIGDRAGYSRGCRVTLAKMKGWYEPAKRPRKRTR
jgi:hypothetical protein